MKLPDRTLCQERLGLIFPEPLPQRGRLMNQLAASAVFVCLYVGAIENERKVRPSMVLWMCDEAARRTAEDERRHWYEAALRGKRELAELLAGWGLSHRPWYADNTREPLRDETFRAWGRFGAILRDETVPTTSAKPQWALAAEFAELFDPTLRGTDLTERIDDWQDDHLGAVGRTRIALTRQLAGADERVIVELPGGLKRTLAPGGSSLILKGVIEELAPRLLEQPTVLFISESRQHLDVVDARLLQELGITADVARLLPDALLFDAGKGLFWFVEAVLTDGAIDEGRRSALEEWANDQQIPTDRCRYVTAFVGRTAGPFRRLVSSLAWGTYAWFLDEPDKILHFEDFPEHDSSTSSR
jgi:hypothetical protein